MMTGPSSISIGYRDLPASCRRVTVTILMDAKAAMVAISANVQMV